MANQSVLELAVGTGKWDAGLKKAQQSLNNFTQAQGGLQQALEKENAKMTEFVKMIGKMDSTAKTAKGQMNDYKSTIEQLTMQYNRMTDAQKKTIGQEWQKSIENLREKYKAVNDEVKDINKSLGDGKFGQFGNLIDSFGHRMGVTGNLTELLTSKTALMTAGIGAAAAAIGKSTEAWVKYNAELAKQDQITTVTTGLKGDDADRMTDKMRALSDTYKVEFREAINAANTLMSQFGESGDSAIQLIKDGMQGMIQGDGGKLLSMIQQYAPAFRDAGVSASQLVAVIQNSEGGIFTDQNMQAIVMGIKNIRLMTKGTSDALAQLGIDGQKMSEQMSNGTLTVFDALKKVATELQTVDSNSKTAGEVMQTVFGRQGAMAGTNLAKAIESLNTNLEETKKQTGEVGEAFADLQEANEKLNVAIREAFSYDGWEQMATGIKAKLVTALAEVVGWLGKIREMLTGENTVGWNITPKPGVVNVADDPNVDDHGNYIRKPTNNSGMQVNPAPPKPTVIFPPKTTLKTGSSSTVKLPTASDFEKFNTKTILGADALKGSDDANFLSPYLMMLDEIKEKILDIQDTDWTKTFGGVSDEYLSPLQRMNKELAIMKANLESAPSTEAYQAGLQAIADKEKEIANFKGIDLSKDAKSTAKSFQEAAGAISQVGNALNSIEDPTAKILGIIAQAIASVAAGAGQAVAAKDTTSSGWAWIGAAAAITASMVAMISQIHSATGYAQGGIVDGRGGGFVGGTAYSGDNIGNVRLDSGELVLNRAQQSNLANALQSNPMGRMQLSAVVTGEQIRLVLNNNGRRTGRGEYVTTNFT